MSIQLISISHKTAPLNVREKFAFTPQQQASILEELYSWVFISECVIISTCNRTEVYLWSENKEKAREIFEYTQGVLLRSAGLENMADVGHIFRFYSGDKAIHHLF